MLRITVELLPLGDESRAQHLGTAKIWNDGEGLPTRADYHATFSKWGRPKELWRTGRVEGFRRKARGPWDLLYLALKDAVGNRNPFDPSGQP